MNKSSEALTRHFCIYFQFVFNKHFKSYCSKSLLACGKGKKNLFLQHYRHQKIRKYGAMKRQQLRKIKVDLLSVSNKKRVLKGSFLPA